MYLTDKRYLKMQKLRLLIFCLYLRKVDLVTCLVKHCSWFS